MSVSTKIRSGQRGFANHINQLDHHLPASPPGLAPLLVAVLAQRLEDGRVAAPACPVLGCQALAVARLGVGAVAQEEERALAVAVGGGEQEPGDAPLPGARAVARFGWNGLFGRCGAWGGLAAVRSCGGEIFARAPRLQGQRRAPL
eukprot:4726280-Prymnesium_polylepis.1